MTNSTTHRYYLSSKKALPTSIAEAISIWQKKFGEKKRKVQTSKNTYSKNVWTNQLKIKKNNNEYIITFALLFLFLMCDLFLCNNYGIEVYI